MYKIAVLVGSLRKASLNMKMAKALVALAPSSLSLEIVPIGHLPFYNEDLEASPPDEWKGFREQLKRFHGVLFVTPEYNRSVPAVLKNALDVGSRPMEQKIWTGKPGAIISVSPGNIGGFGANHHLRQSLVFLNVPTMPQPEAYIAGAAKLFTEHGELTNDGTTQFLTTFIESFARWVERLLRK